MNSEDGSSLQSGQENSCDILLQEFNSITDMESDIVFDRTESFSRYKRFKFYVLSFCLRNYLKIISLLLFVLLLVIGLVIFQFYYYNFQRNNDNSHQYNNVKSYNEAVVKHTTEYFDKETVTNSTPMFQVVITTPTPDKDKNKMIKFQEVNTVEGTEDSNDVNVTSETELQKSICQRTKCFSSICKPRDIEIMTLRVYACCCLPGTLVFKYFEDEVFNKRLCFQYLPDDPRKMSDYDLAAIPPLDNLFGSWVRVSNSMIPFWLLCFDGISI